MSLWKWSTLPSGEVLVDTGGGLAEFTYSAPPQAQIDRVLGWGSIADRASKEMGAPIWWILGVMWAESGSG